MKRMWLFVPVVATIIGVGVLVSGVARAQENAPAGTSVASTFASRVATILGLDSTQVQNAMDQAGREMRDEALQKKLDALVAQGRLTQQQADAYKQWYQAKPSDVPGLRGHEFGSGFGGHGHGHGMRGRGESHKSFAPPSQQQAAPAGAVLQ
jgi:hypothetical protein